MSRVFSLAAAVGSLALMASSGAALAQSHDQQCAQFQSVIQSAAPDSGALASLEHTVAVLRSAIGMIDLPCGAPYIVSTDKAAIAQERARLYDAWNTARSNCLQLTSGEPSDRSPCKAEVSPGS
jgi:hypothetical protein